MASTELPTDDGSHPYGRLDPASRFMDGISDWFNPILVKEVRQSLKSRQFVVTFMLLLGGSWLVSFFALISGGEGIEFGDVGQQLFVVYYGVLCVALLIVVPFTTFRSLLAERDENTMDLLTNTMQGPEQIVRGKLLSAVLQMFVFYAAVAPFVAFTSLLKGFDVAAAAYALCLAGFLSVCCCIASLFLSILSRARAWQALSMLGLLGGLVTVFTSVVGTIWFTSSDLASSLARLLGIGIFGGPEFWLINLVLVGAGGSYCVLLFKVTTAQLTFEADNRSTGIRLVTTLQFVVFWMLAFSPWWLDALGNLLADVSFLAWLAPTLQGMRPGSLVNEIDDLSAAMSTVCFIQLTIIGLFAATERETLSRRTLRSLPSHGFLRTVCAPWLPGHGRGFLYALSQVFVMWWLVLALAAWVEAGTPLAAPVYISLVFNGRYEVMGDVVQYVTCCGAYVVIYLGIGTFGASLMLREGSDLKPTHVRVITLLIALFGVLLPYVLTMTEWIDYRPYSLWFLGSPGDTLEQVRDGRELGNVITTILLALAAIVVLLNSRAVFRGLGEVMNADPATLRRIDEERHERVEKALREFTAASTAEEAS